ncbi:unnamed protein product [Macrosiphum euphorbiae]|uniref:DDE Tnp4 domain-containing protein n=1 Tax=Macrosiphum euphorbiae TaxID=13131 RepID=A0AAV0X4F1_9HEMI|nr:unnamed protein product [Macrosiphum euphorbiae]
MGTHKELDSLKLQLLKDFLLNKNKLSSYIVQGFPTHKRTLFDIITSTLNDDNDDGDEMNVFIRFERQVRSKIKNFTEVTVLDMTDKDFKIHFRLTRESIEFKCSIEKQILVFTWYMANCETHRQIANRFNLSDSTSHGIIINCLLQLNTLNRVFIKWPSGQRAIETMEKFHALRQTSFPNVIGAVDGCHIAILAPWEKRSVMPKLDRNMFYNRKQVPSVLLQGIVNADQIFIDVFAGWPGSSHDARVFRKSTIGQNILENHGSILPPNCHILGDGAYPLTEKIMVPYKDNGHLTQNQKNFNKILSSSRVVVEQAFGKLIGRFRKLKYISH